MASTGAMGSDSSSPDGIPTERYNGSKKSKEHFGSPDVGGPRNSLHGNADDMLAMLGYQSELVRTRSTWHVAFMSFVLASVPYGLSTTLYYPLIGGGPVTVIWGWVIVCSIMLCVAVSLGEIISVYPTAGGVYYQTFMLSPPSYRRLTAWICGWCYTLGTITITLAVSFGTTLFFTGCLNVFTDSEGEMIFPGERYQIYLIFLGITLLQTAISSLANKWLPILDTITVFWTFLAVFCTLVATLVVARHGRNKASYVFGSFEPSSGWPPGWSFCIGLLHGAYSTSATGMIGSMCEEVREPATQVPKAMIGTIGLNFLCGLIYLLPLMFVLPSIAEVLDSPTGQPLPTILYSALGTQGGTFALALPIIILALLCGTSCTTVASRSIWAFARDGAIPGSRWWRQVNPTLGVPFNAMLLSMAVQLLLGLIYFGSDAAFNAFVGVGVIFLTLSYTTPIFVSLINGRKNLKDGLFIFPKLGVFCNIVACVWCPFLMPLLSVPPAVPVEASTMNYAVVVFAGGTAISAIWYFVWGRKNYQGPPVKAEEVEVRRASVVHQD